MSIPRLILLAALLISGGAQAERIKDIASIQGVRVNQLAGYGLVVGLDGTGQLLESRIDLGLNGADRQGQRDLALELVEGFHSYGHDVLSVSKLLVSGVSGARGRTRTGTFLRTSGPKPGASTNFATRAVR